MDGSQKRAVVRVGDLVLCPDTYPVECFGGPNDGEFRPANENGLRSGGMYVVINGEPNHIVGRRYVPDA